MNKLYASILSLSILAGCSKFEGTGAFNPAQIDPITKEVINSGYENFKTAFSLRGNLDINGRKGSILELSSMNTFTRTNSIKFINYDDTPTVDSVVINAFPIIEHKGLNDSTYEQFKEQSQFTSTFKYLAGEIFRRGIL